MFSSTCQELLNFSIYSDHSLTTLTHAIQKFKVATLTDHALTTPTDAIQKLPPTIFKIYCFEETHNGEDTGIICFL